MNDPWHPSRINYNYDYTDHAISGRMCTVSMKLSPLSSETLPDVELKRMMMYELVKEMEKQKCVEFTRMYLPDGNTQIHARIYVTPNDKVFILRTYNKA